MYYARYSKYMYIYIISLHMITYTAVILCLHIFTHVFTVFFVLPVINHTIQITQIACLLTN